MRLVTVAGGSLEYGTVKAWCCNFLCSFTLMNLSITKIQERSFLRRRNSYLTCYLLKSWRLCSFTRRFFSLLFRLLKTAQWRQTTLINPVIPRCVGIRKYLPVGRKRERSKEQMVFEYSGLCLWRAEICATGPQTDADSVGSVEEKPAPLPRPACDCTTRTASMTGLKRQHCFVLCYSRWITGKQWGVSVFLDFTV